MSDLIFYKIFRDYFDMIVEKYNGDYIQVYEYFNDIYNIDANKLEKMLDKCK